MSEHISFLPYKIINTCYKIGIKRPTKTLYNELLHVNYEKTKQKSKNITNSIKYGEMFLNNIDEKGITNMKEIRTLLHLTHTNKIPEDLFNKVCDNIINKIENIKTIKFTDFRDSLYEILTYDIEMNECLWYIIYYFVSDNRLTEKDISDILINCYIFFKYFNNNYRPIYHLENIMFYIIKKIYNFNELPKSMRNT